jgi:hypothetical protein
MTRVPTTLTARDLPWLCLVLFLLVAAIFGRSR